jgi:DNA-binding transcriptional regulator YiaG
MSEKTIKNYTYEGLGISVQVKNVEMEKLIIADDLQPVINIKKVSDDAFRALSIQENKFTGNDLHFIQDYMRIHLQMSANEFAKALNVSGKEIEAWERFDDKPANLDAGTEKLLKQQMQELIVKKSPLASKGLFSDKKSTDSSPSESADKQQKPRTPKRK